MWTLLLASILITICLIFGILDHVILLIITLPLILFGSLIEKKLFGQFQEPNKLVSTIIFLYLGFTILSIVYKVYL